MIYPLLDHVTYRGNPTSSLWFANIIAELCAGQEGTPKQILDLLRWRGLLGSLLLLLLALIFLLLGRLFAAAEKGEVFSLKSVRLIGLMSWCFIACSIMGNVFSYVLVHLLARDLPNQYLNAFKAIGTGENVTISMIGASWSLDPTALFLGLFAFTLAEVFRQGLLLRQENELTI
jgi:hypothetical protein